MVLLALLLVWLEISDPDFKNQFDSHLNANPSRGPNPKQPCFTEFRFEAALTQGTLFMRWYDISGAVGTWGSSTECRPYAVILRRRR